MLTVHWKLPLRLAVLTTSLAALVLLPAPSRGQAALGAEEFRLLPLRIHLLRAKQAPELDSKLRESDARRVLGKINGIWKQAGIQFWAESILSEDAAAQELYASFGENRSEAHLRLVRPKGSLSDQLFHLYFLREMRPNGIYLNSYQLLFVKDTAELDPVPGGIDEPLPRVSAHEIGHALDLPHRQDVFNLMASGTTGTALNEEEIRTARKATERFTWCLKPDAALKLANQKATTVPQEAKALYTTLSGLPASEVAAEARDRLSGKGG